MQSVFELAMPRRDHRPTRDPLQSLTSREGEVLALMAEGWSNLAIAERLFIGPGTIEKHIRSIYIKLGLGHDDIGHRRVLAVLAYLKPDGDRRALPRHP